MSELLAQQWRFEVMPFGSIADHAGATGKQLTMPVTCSPKHGPDRTVAVASTLRAMGHTVIVHLAARMVRGPEHVDALLAAMEQADIHDAFVIGGDATGPVGPYGSALELLAELRRRDVLRSIGVGAYPEGHPLIDDDTLLTDLRRKDELADYMVTQMCFDARALVRWLARMREVGVGMPVYLGVPGAVDRKRLLEISLRVGVGTSVSFLKKQPSARRLLGRGSDVIKGFFEAVAPLVGSEAGVDGLHFFTFNRLLETLELLQLAPAEQSGASEAVRELRDRRRQRL